MLSVLFAAFPYLLPYQFAGDVTTADNAGWKVSRVRVEGARFVNDRGPIRFLGTNLTGPANFMDQGTAKRVAKRLADLGFNCVRLHYMDAKPYPYLKSGGGLPTLYRTDAKDHSRFDDDQLDKLDFFLAELKKRGVYVDLNLHVGRRLGEADGLPAREPFNGKYTSIFHPGSIALQKEFNRQLLTHVNPYTGLSYAEDPVIAVVEIMNESSFRSPWKTERLGRYDFGHPGAPAPRGEQCGKDYVIPDAYLEELRDQWVGWQRKRGSAPLLEKLPVRDEVSKEMRERFSQFLHDVEQAYYDTMYAQLKNELKVQACVSGCQLAFSPDDIQSRYDYVDAHSYFQHPFTDREGRYLNGVRSSLHELVCLTYLDKMYTWASDRKKPYTISEFNLPYPNPHSAEFMPVAAALAAVWSWSGFFQYGYSHSPARDFMESGCIVNRPCFDSLARTDCLAHLPAASAMFVRGDVTSSNQVVWTKGPDATFAVDSPDTKFFTGFVRGRTFDLGDVRLSVGKTERDWCTVSLTSKNRGGFGKRGASCILLAATGGCANTGFRTEPVKVGDDEDGWIRILDNGTAPVLCEGIPAEIGLKSASADRVKVYALAADDSRADEVPVRAAASGGCVFTIGPKNRTIRYEIMIY